MPETAVDHPVLGHFRQKHPKTGKSVSYDPNGEDGWPGAKSVISLVPGSDEAEYLLGHHLLDGENPRHGPLIGKPVEAPVESKPASRTPAKPADSKES